jgi:hypothetical protein
MSDIEPDRRSLESRMTSDDQLTNAELRLRGRAGLALYLFAGLAVSGALIIDSCFA